MTTAVLGSDMQSRVDTRQRRRKNRQSRDFDDQNAESMESPSDRIPLQETADGERGAGHASNSGDGSSGIPQGRSRNRRPRRRSRMENGELYDDVETNTLETPEKKRHKRPPPSSRHVRRSASAEMVDREKYDRGDGENVSPSRRRPRRKKVHGSRDVMDGEDFDEALEDNVGGIEQGRRSRPRKHKSKKPPRVQNATSAEEDNYNADMDGEVSVVDFYKVDKEDIVTDTTEPSAPPPPPNVVQNLPSQPLDFLFIERRDGGFRSERKTHLAQMEEDRRDATLSTVIKEETTATFAVSVHRAFRSFSLFCHGLLAGLALGQCIFVYSLSTHTSGDETFLEYYYNLAQPIHSLYYMLFAICTVSVFDRYDMANPRSGFFHGLFTRPSKILSISAYLLALVLSISLANIDDRISLFKSGQDLWKSEETSSLLETWRIINLMRVLGAVLGWVLVAAVQPNKDFTAQNLYEGDLMLGDERLNASQNDAMANQAV